MIGGGLAGCWASLRAAELGARVGVIEKAYVSSGGCSPVCGGVMTAPTDEDDLSLWYEEFLRRGQYMSNRAWLDVFLREQRERIKDLQRLGAPLLTDAGGQLKRIKSRGMSHVQCLQFTPLKLMAIMREEMERRGVIIFDRLAVTELLTSDGEYPTRGSVRGAAGFNTRTGEFQAVQAGATVIATGPVNTKATNTADTVTGDGVAMCARAGATLVDMEYGFGGTFTTMMKRYKFPAFNVAVGHGARLVNSAGERFMARYDPERMERSELPRVIAAFLNELVEGRGPVSLDLRHCDDTFWDDLTQVKGKKVAGILLSGKVPDPREQPIPIEPRWNVWSHRCGVRIDLDCTTSLPGLFAAGSMVKNEVTGTHASAGIPTAFCGVSGYRAGEAAVEWARGSTRDEPPAEALERLRQQALAPLSRSGGPCPDDLFQELGQAQSNPFQTMILSQTSIDDMLGLLGELRSGWERVSAPTPHELVKAHEVRCAIECAQLIYISAQDRTESRESFFREDYPETDNDNWFCWHDIRRTPDGWTFDRRPIPREPELDSLAPRKKSPIGAIMDHSYRPEDFD